MELSMEDTLTKWNLGQLIPVFQENEIDLKTFMNLNDDEIKELIPKIGIRKKFMENYNKLILGKAIEENMLIIESGSGDSSSTLSFESSASGSSALEDDLANKGYYYPQRATVGWPYELSSHENSVRKLIDSTVDGKIIVASYAEGKQFLRSKLCELIIKEELKNDPDRKIPSSRFAQLADEINQVFLHEAQELYFVPYVKNPEGSPRAARGKLYSTYVYMRKNLRKLGLIKNSNSEKSVEEGQLNENNEDVQWLKNNSTPFVETTERWRKTTNCRISQFPSTILDYFQTFPALSHPQGHTLLEIDFKNLYPDKVNLLFSKWAQLVPKLLKILENRNDPYINKILLEYRALEEKNDELFVLLNLPLLFTCTNIKTKKGAFKPSRVEQKEAFISHLKDINDFEASLQQRQEKYASFQLTCQPLPIIIGNLNSIQSTFVVCENIKYKTETPLKAVDVCFKLFHALNAQYPKEADCVWMFIQQYIYELNTEFDRKYVSVSTLISDINRQSA